MIQVHDMPQGSVEWYQARLGVPTASMFDVMLKSGRGGKPSEQRMTYLYKLAGERLTGELPENFTSYQTKRGHEMEPEARQLYAFMHDADPVQVGFITNGPKGCSPDSLIGESGMLEIKTKAAHVLLKAHEGGGFPDEHYAQCQGQLWVAEREWVDLICYWPKMPPLIVRANRDEAYISSLAAAVDQFNDELETLVAKYSSYRKAA